MTVITSLWTWTTPAQFNPEDDFFSDGNIQSSNGVRQAFTDEDILKLIGLVKAIAKECEGLSPHQKFKHDPTGRIIWMRHHMNRTQQALVDSGTMAMGNTIAIYSPSGVVDLSPFIKNRDYFPLI